MSDYKRVIQEIKCLKSMIPSGGGKWNFKEIWAQIKTTQAAFNGSRFPTREEHQEAWSDFQNLVNKVKEKQAEGRELSAELRDRIVGRAEKIPPSDDRWVEAVLTLGISVVIEVLLGISDSRKQTLQDANKALKELQTFVQKENNNLPGQDRCIPSPQRR